MSVPVRAAAACADGRADPKRTVLWCNTWGTAKLGGEQLGLTKGPERWEMVRWIKVDAEKLLSCPEARPTYPAQTELRSHNSLAFAGLFGGATESKAEDVIL